MYLFLIGSDMMNYNYDIDMENPFEPGKSVSPDRFKGREKNIKKILRDMGKVQKGNVQHFFLTGNKGMGKTSLAEFVKEYVEINYGMIGIYVSNKGNNSLNSLITAIIQAFLNKIPRNVLFEKIKTLFSSIESVEIIGNRVSFKPSKSLIVDIEKDFPYYLNQIIKDLPTNNGVFLIIDDINGLSESKKFVDWYKLFADTIEVNRGDFNLPLYVLFAAYPDKFDSLVYEEPSFGRIFHYDEIDRLSDLEVKEFFKDTFSSVNKQINDNSLELLSYFSGGIPLIMQEIGYSIYWLSEKTTIDEEDVLNGIMEAIGELESKQIRNIVNQISSDDFEDLLLKIASQKQQSYIETDFKEKLNWDEYNVWDEFLDCMIKLGVIKTSNRKSNLKFSFSNQFYFTYFWLKSLNLHEEFAKIES